MDTFIGTKQIQAEPCKAWKQSGEHCIGAEGYKVAYDDGYTSWSPKKQFEDAYQNLSEGMSFGHAIVMAEAGAKIARAGWNGKGMWVIYNAASRGETHPMFDGSVYKNHGVDECEILPHFDMYTVNADGRRAMLPGWLASQTDMIAKDWRIVK